MRYKGVALTRAGTARRTGNDRVFLHTRREAEARGTEKIELGALAAAVIAVREGLAPLSPDEYVAMAASLGVQTLRGNGGSEAAPDAGDAQLAALPQVVPAVNLKPSILSRCDFVAVPNALHQPGHWGLGQQQQLQRWQRWQPRCQASCSPGP